VVLPTDPDGRDGGELRHLRDLLAEVRQQRDDYAGQLSAKDRQITELHVLVQRALDQRPALVLPAPVPVETAPPARPHWWRRLVSDGPPLRQGAPGGAAAWPD
jgi:hypothetical protein